MSHFTNVETKIQSLVLLKQVLKELGYAYEEGQVQVRGYRGQLTKADLVIRTKTSYDIGVVQTAKGYELTGDWDMLQIRAGIEKEEFINKVHQRYSYHAVTEELKKKGYQVVNEETKQDQHIHLTLRRWE